MNFCQFWNALNGEPYHNVPPPVRYDMADYAKSISSGSSFANVEGGDYHLRPITHEDTGRYSADDVVSHYAKLHAGKNPLRLGKSMTDSEFKKFFGHTW